MPSASSPSSSYIAAVSFRLWVFLYMYTHETTSLACGYYPWPGSSYKIMQVIPGPVLSPLTMQLTMAFGLVQMQALLIPTIHGQRCYRPSRTSRQLHVSWMYLSASCIKLNCSLLKTVLSIGASRSQRTWLTFIHILIVLTAGLLCYYSLVS